MFNVGDDVAVIRARHGWHDGRLKGKVVEKYQKKGRMTFSFTVKGDDGELYEINRANDLRKA
jgi:hypothetical protein